MPKSMSIARSWFPPTDSNTDWLPRIYVHTVINYQTLIWAYRMVTSKSGKIACNEATCGSSGGSVSVAGAGSGTGRSGREGASGSCVVVILMLEGGGEFSRAAGTGGLFVVGVVSAATVGSGAADSGGALSTSGEVVGSS